MEELMVKLATCKSKKEHDKLLDQVIKAKNMKSVNVQLGKKADS